MKKLSKIAYLALLLPMMVACGETPASSKTSTGPASNTPAASSVTPASSEQASTSEKAEESSVLPGGKQKYTFEAEYSPDIPDLEGNGFSGNATGTSMILQDRDGSKHASNGFYLSFLYKPGLSVTYTINSDKAVTDALFEWRIMIEYYDQNINSNDYEVSVNGSPILYEAIDLKLPTGSNHTDFTDYTLTTSLSLQQGENVIAFTTNNANLQKGTMISTAPVLDCFYITTDATLTWNPQLDNIE